MNTNNQKKRNNEYNKNNGYLFVYINYDIQQKNRMWLFLYCDTQNKSVVHSENQNTAPSTFLALISHHLKVLLRFLLLPREQVVPVHR